MTRDEVLAMLRARYPEIRRRFGVARLAVFGSVARDEARPDSDVDILVGFDGPTGFDGYFDLRFFLEDLLSRPVDLLTEAALRPILRENVAREAIHVA